MLKHLRTQLFSKILSLPRKLFTTQIPIQEVIKFNKPENMSNEEERKFYELEFDKIKKKKESK